MGFLDAIGNISSASPTAKPVTSVSNNATNTTTISFLSVFADLPTTLGPKVSNKVNVSVSCDASGNVEDIKIGDNKYVTESEMLKDFDLDGNGVVSMSEFNAEKGKVNWNTIGTMSIQFLAGATVYGSSSSEVLDQQTAVKLVLDTFYKTNNYLQSLGLTMTTPTSIMLGDNGAGCYMANGVWHLSGINEEILADKTFQTSLQAQYPNLGYTSLEAFARYFTNDLLVKDGKPGINIAPSVSTQHPGQYIYRTDLESLNGNNITKAYKEFNAGKITFDQLNKIIGMVSNNNISIYLSIKDLDPATIKAALDILKTKNISNPTGLDIGNAVVQADNTLNAGADYAQISNSFAEHGINV